MPSCSLATGNASHLCPALSPWVWGAPPSLAWAGFASICIGSWGPVLGRGCSVTPRVSCAAPRLLLPGAGWFFFSLFPPVRRLLTCENYGLSVNIILLPFLYFPPSREGDLGTPGGPHPAPAAGFPLSLPGPSPAPALSQEVRAQRGAGPVQATPAVLPAPPPVPGGAGAARVRAPQATPASLPSLLPAPRSAPFLTVGPCGLLWPRPRRQRGRPGRLPCQFQVLLLDDASGVPSVPGPRRAAVPRARDNICCPPRTPRASGAEAAEGGLLSSGSPVLGPVPSEEEEEPRLR